MLQITLVTLFLFSILILQFPSITNAAHARKRPTITKSSTSVNTQRNKYDRQITTFDTNGNLLQVEYAHESTKRGKSCAFVHLSSGMMDDINSCSSNRDCIIAVIKRDDDSNNNDDNNALSESEDKHNVNTKATSTCTSTTSISTSTSTSTPTQGMYRLSNGILCKMTGLDGDGRLLARHLQSASHQLAWTEGFLSSTMSSSTMSSSSSSSLSMVCNNDVQVRPIAKLCGEVQHSLTIRNGARPLAVDAVLMGISSFSSSSKYRYHPPLSLFHCTVGGIVNECEFCSSGKDSNLILNGLDGIMKEFKELNALNNHFDVDGNNGIHRNNDDDIDDPSSSMISSSLSRRTTFLQRKLIQNMSKLILDPTTSSLSSYKNNNNSNNNIQSSFMKQPTQPTKNNNNNNNNDKKGNGTVDIYIIQSNGQCRGGIEIKCALSVDESKLEHVSHLLIVDGCD